MVDTPSDPTGAQTGFLSLLPYMADEGGTVEGLIGTVAPWGSPMASALIGKDEKGEPWLGLINEIPYSWLRTAQQIPKDQLEMLHLRRLAVDCQLATGQDLFDALKPGGDPPDILAFAADRQIGWELTVFTIPERRLANSLFFNVIDRLADQQRHRIRHLAGFHIFMWFGGAADPAGLPFKAKDGGAYDRLVEELVAYRPDHKQFMTTGEMPEKLDGRFGPVRTPEDVSFYTVPLVGGVPASGLFATTGISAGLAFQSDHKARTEWQALRKVVDRKDREGNDVLLISVGAPDRMGRCFAAEEVLANFLIDNPEPVTAKHLSSVILHFWSTGVAVELLGDCPQEMWKPLYQGYAPAHQPFPAYQSPDPQQS